MEGSPMGIQERKGREKEARREEIIVAAEKVFFEKGPASATMDDIAQAAELSKGTLYLYYRTKEDIFVAVTYRGMEIMYHLFEHAVATHESSIKHIFNLAQAYQRFFAEHRNYFRMMYFFESPQFHENVSEEVKEQCLANDRKVWDLVTGLIERAQKEGMLHSDLNPMEVGIMLWSNSNGFLRLIDRQADMWAQAFGIDFEQTLRKSNALLMEAMMTKKGKQEHPWVLEILHGASQRDLNDHR
jgi:TetR/AcrR family transcriptional regulator